MPPQPDKPAEDDSLTAALTTADRARLRRAFGAVLSMCWVFFGDREPGQSQPRADAPSQENPRHRRT